MSLINQMLQELDARGSQAALGGVLQGQVRAVPRRRGRNLALISVLVLACLLCAGIFWLGRTAPAHNGPRSVATPPVPSMPELSLKIDDVLGLAQMTSAPLPSTGPETLTVTSGDSASAEHLASLTSLGPNQIGAPAQAAASIPAAVPAMTTSSAQASSPTGAQVATPAVKSVLPAGEGLHKRVRVNSGELEAPSAPVRETPPIRIVSAPAAAPSIEAAVIAKQVKELTPRQLAENEYRKATGLIQQGRSTESINTLEQALQLDSRHVEARQTLAGLLIQLRRQDDAIRVLREGLQLDVTQSGLAMILARLQLERSEMKPAIETLQRSLPYAADRADYQAFLAALLQRDGRHREAIDYYSQALRKSPDNAVWWMGKGMSLQAESRIPEAIEAFKRAKTANGLSAELRAFVDDRLNSL